MDGSGAGGFEQANVRKWGSVSERDRMRELSRMASLSNFDRMYVHEPPQFTVSRRDLVKKHL